MKTNKFGEIIYNEDDICDLIMSGQDVVNIANLTVDTNLDIQGITALVEDPGSMLTWTLPNDNNISVPEFDLVRQANWFMPDQYKQLDIAEYVLGLCETQEQLQRCGEELLLFQERNLFDLLKYLKYLVDVMRDNQVIWGVGRGSSVASYVLYKLGVHRIDSMYYDLDPSEFLR